jgi:prephenate dehydrogenase
MKIEIKEEIAKYPGRSRDFLPQHPLAGVSIKVVYHIFVWFSQYLFGKGVKQEVFLCQNVAHALELRLL